MRKGFSLLELSILLVIFGGIAAMSTTLGSKWAEGEEFKTSKKNIQTLESAIDAYVRLNQRLPCPADPSLAPTDANFGKEVSGYGACTAATTNAGFVKKGVVPFQTLGVGKSLAYDAWGNRITYYVDTRMTQENAMDAFPPQNTAIGDITIKDIAGGQRTTKAVYALVSHGAKAHGAVTRDGTTKTLSNPNAEELNNSDLNADGTPNLNKELVQAMSGKGSDNREFDDIVAYKKRAGLGNSPVNAVENCVGGTRNWSSGGYNCTGSVTDVADGESVLVSDTTLPDSGSAIVTCDSGTLSQSNEICTHTPVNCAAGGVSWAAHAACAGTVATTTTHGTSTATINNTTGGRTGTATFLCNDGTLTVNPGATCGNNCTAGTANWSGASNCTQTYGALNHLANSTIADTTAPGTGNTTVTCTNGAISQSGATCNLAGCGATTLSWGAGCSAAVTAQSSGYSAGITNSAGGYSGTATASCTDGAWSTSAATCTASCPAQAVNWTVSGQNCSQSTGSTLLHGAVTTLTDAVQNSTGSVTVTCNNGTLNQSSASCVTQCVGGTSNWTVGGNTCTQTYATLAHGGSTSVTDSTAPTTGSATLSCTNGVVGQSGTTCASAGNCTVAAGTTWTVGANTCTVPTTVNITHGNDGSATDSTAPTTGSANWSCNNGTVTIYADATCNAPISCSLPWGGSIAHGASVTAYQTATVPCGNSCASQTRTCSNGTLSGSYTNASCSVASCGSTCLPFSGGCCPAGTTGGIISSTGGFPPLATCHAWCQTIPNTTCCQYLGGVCSAYHSGGVGGCSGPRGRQMTQCTP